jgi:hypothetical protein
MIFRWGLPQPTFIPVTILAINTTNDEENEMKVKKEEKFYSCMSKLGMSLIIIGFGFQFVATIDFKNKIRNNHRKHTKKEQ